MVSTLVKRFKAIFDRDRLLDWARELGAVVRLRDLHPQDFCLALVSCTMGDEERSIASARRLFFHLTGTMPEESSFYDRFTCAMFLLWQRILDHAMKSCSRQRREALYLALRGTGILDILAIDASQVALPALAAEVLPSTDDGHGGFKLTATLSLLHQTVQGISVTDARTHDRRALRLARWLHGLLLLFDRGYFDYQLFDTIALRGGFFITRLKKSAKPVITAIHSGLGQSHVGQVLTRDLPFRGVVDLEATFRSGGRSRVLRVIRVTVPHERPDGRSERVWFPS